MNISILTTQTTTHMNKANKPYQQLEVTFKNNTFGKVESKKLMPFGVQEGAFKALASSQQGDIFEVTVVKNAAGFNDWTEVKQQAPGMAGQASAGTLPPQTKGTISGAGVQVKSTYETPDERAKKQVYIIKQSSISSAIETLKQEKKVVNPDDVIQLATKYFTWVMQSPEEAVKQDIFSSVNDFPDVE